MLQKGTTGRARAVQANNMNFKLRCDDKLLALELVYLCCSMKHLKELVEDEATMSDRSAYVPRNF